MSVCRAAFDLVNFESVILYNTATLLENSSLMQLYVFKGVKKPGVGNISKLNFFLLASQNRMEDFREITWVWQTILLGLMVQEAPLIPETHTMHVHVINGVFLPVWLIITLIGLLGNGVASTNLNISVFRNRFVPTCIHDVLLQDMPNSFIISTSEFD